MNDEKKDRLPHDNWAEYYDFVYERTFGKVYESFTEISLNAVRQLAKPGVSTIQDYGSGTGRLAIPLAREGYDVIAVEQSAAMLNVLKHKAAVLNLKIETVNSYAKDYRGRSGELALCVFTVLNYVVDEAELLEMFRNINKHLNTEGLFFFDLADSVFFSHGRSPEIIKPDFRRLIEITQTGHNLYEYSESCNGVTGGREFSYSDRFPLRYWEFEEVDRILLKAGFAKVNRHFPEFRAAGASYYLYRKA